MAEDAEEAVTSVVGVVERQVVGEVAQQSGDWFEPLIQFNAGIIAGIDGARRRAFRSL